MANESPGVRCCKAALCLVSFPLGFVYGVCDALSKKLCSRCRHRCCDVVRAASQGRGTAAYKILVESDDEADARRRGFFVSYAEWTPPTWPFISHATDESRARAQVSVAPVMDAQQQPSHAPEIALQVEIGEPTGDPTPPASEESPSEQAALEAVAAVRDARAEWEKLEEDQFEAELAELEVAASAAARAQQEAENMGT